MKKLTFTAFLLLIFFQQISAQKSMIFQPGPGKNNGSDSGSLTGGKDAFTNQASPGAVSDTTYYLISSPISNCNSTHMQIFMQYDLSSLPAQVDSVFAGFTHYPHTTYCYSNCVADWYFYVLKEAWKENEITYSSHPALDTAFYGPIHITFPNDFGKREYNITNMYKQWKSGAVKNYGFAIASPTVGCNNAAVIFYAHSSDDTAVATRPYLKIYYPEVNQVKTIAKMNFKVFPNPAKDFIQIQFSNPPSKSTTVSICDMSGRSIFTEVLNSDFNQTNWRINTKQMAGGLYYVLVENNMQREIQKVWIE